MKRFFGYIASIGMVLALTACAATSEQSSAQTESKDTAESSDERDVSCRTEQGVGGRLGRRVCRERN